MTREKALQFGMLHAAKMPDAADEKRVYSLYYDFDSASTACARTRCWRSTAARPKRSCRSRGRARARLAAGHRRHFRPDRALALGRTCNAPADAAERLLLPAIERDVRRR